MRDIYLTRVCLHGSSQNDVTFDAKYLANRSVVKCAIERFVAMNLDNPVWETSLVCITTKPGYVSAARDGVDWPWEVVGARELTAQEKECLS